MNIAIHGERELLVRMANKLREFGYTTVKDYEDTHDIDALVIYGNEVRLTDWFFRPSFSDNHIVTPSNYNEILNIIIESKKNGTK